MGGIMSVTGTADGPPVKVGVPAADMAGAVFTTQAILAALFARERTGRGQRVDVSLLDSLLAYQVVPLSMFLSGGETPKRLGSAAPYAAPNEAYPTLDGYIMVAAYTPERWPALCRVLDLPELATDPRFDTNQKRVEGRDSLSEVLEPMFRARTTREWIKLLDEADVLCGPLLSYDELVSEEHIVQGHSLVTVRHPAIGEFRSPGYPGRFADPTASDLGPPPPLPGEHSEVVLSEFGLQENRIRELISHGVVNGDPADQRSKR
jgi:crotonobetainyl-CoA:carnitine CoA-transferase CaiB-like acyl-CoA transferase